MLLNYCLPSRKNITVQGSYFHFQHWQYYFSDVKIVPLSHRQHVGNNIKIKHFVFNL